MYISKELLIKIIYIAITVIHIVMYFILFYKLHKLKGGLTSTSGVGIIDKAKKLITMLFSPSKSILEAITEFIKTEVKTLTPTNKDEVEDKKEDG